MVFDSGDVTMTLHVVREPDDTRLAELRVTEDGDVRGTVTLAAGQVRGIVLETGGAGPHAVRVSEVEAAFDTTVRFWRSWLARSTYRGRWREALNRSGLRTGADRQRRVRPAATRHLRRDPGRPAGVTYGRVSGQRDAIYTQVWRRGFDPDRQAFVQQYGADVLDSSLPRMPRWASSPPTTRSGRPSSTRPSTAVPRVRR